MQYEDLILKLSNKVESGGPTINDKSSHRNVEKWHHKQQEMLHTKCSTKASLSCYVTQRVINLKLQIEIQSVRKKRFDRVKECHCLQCRRKNHVWSLEAFISALQVGHSRQLGPMSTVLRYAFQVVPYLSCWICVSCVLPLGYQVACLLACFTDWWGCDIAGFRAMLQ